MSYQKELTFAKDLAQEAGEIMRRYFRSQDLGTEWKEDNTPLTVADTQINGLVIRRVKETFPGYGVIGEEDSFETDNKFVWVVDPIDGTVPFSLGMPVSTFSLALVDRSDGQPVVAVVYDPQLKCLYYAVRGGGAFLNGAKLRTAQTSSLNHKYTFVWHGNHQERVYFDKGRCLDNIQKQGGRYFVVPSFVYFASRVASGEFVGAFLDYGSPWDPAAASLLVTEAGGVVTDLDGAKRRFDEFGSGCIMAANQQIHTKLLDIIRNSAP